MKNPYQDNAGAAAAGKKLYGQNCSQCHGNNLQGMGPAPALDNPSTQKATPGELFWFITNGDLNAGMPSWAGLPKQQRWQIVTFLETRVSKTETK
jgi:mono/diheme cytochrome c family protein